MAEVERVLSINDLQGPPFLKGGGATGALIRAHDWSATPLGPPDTWPQALQTAISLMLSAVQPVYIAWGPDLMSFYNDAYLPIVGAKHPGIGMPYAELWAEIWGEFRPIVERTLAGDAQHFTDLPIALAGRQGQPVGYFTFSYTALRDDRGNVAGFYCAATETTDNVLAQAALRDSEMRHRLLIESWTQAIWETSPDGIVTADSPTWRAYTGQTVEEWLGYGWLDAVHAEDRDHAERQWREAIAARRPVDAEFRLRSPRGGWRWTNVRASPVLAPDTRITKWIGVNIDIDTRKRAEVALIESEGRLRSVINGMGEGFALLAPDFTILEHNAEALRIDTRAREEIIGQSHWTAFPGTETSEIGTLYKRAMSERVPVRHEHRYSWPDGRKTWLNLRAYPVGDGLAVFWRDVTDRREAAAKLEASEERYRTLFDIIDEGFCVLEFIDGPGGPLSDYIHVEANPAYTANAGIPDIVGKRAREVMSDDEADAWIKIFAEVLKSGTAIRFERTLEETGRYLELAVFRVEPPAKRQVAVLFKDVSARRHAELALRDLNETLEAQVTERTAERDRVWKNSRDMLAILDSEGVFRAANPAWTVLLGYTTDELVGHGFLEFVVAEDHQPSLAAQKVANREALPLFENRYRHKDGSIRTISWLAVPEGDRLYAYGRDVTAERERQAKLDLAQDALRQSQKMEAMGTLTGGVAHDFNNLLTPIVGSLDLLQRKGVGGEREQRLIAGAILSADRAKTLVQRLLAFARRQPLQSISLDLAPLVRGMADLVASTTGPQIKVVIDVADDLPPASADPNQLEMAILNLTVNARDAMEGGGTLRISAGVADLDRREVLGLREGHYLCLSIADTGTGMDEATLKRAIEPFYSTKGVGKGTGLGLSMVHGLASQLGGALDIRSTQGLGTNVELWIPQSATPLTAKTEVGEPILTAASSGTVLLVDDEELVRMSTAVMLGEMGFIVVEAQSAQAALALVNDGLTPDILITDHLMPGMTGTELARTLRATRPQMQVLVVSGYAESEGIAPDLPRLVKPFREAELIASLAALASATPRMR